MEQKRKALVFIHGFLGSNEQFRGIKSRLEGCGTDFIDHVIAGHGGKLEEFLKSRPTSWQGGINSHLDRLRVEYDELFMVGHSLGGLLAVRSAIASGEKLGGITAIAFPVKIKISVSWLGSFNEATKPAEEGESARVTATRDLSGVEMKGFGDILKAMPNAIRLLGVSKDTRKKLSLLKTPLTVISCGKDGIVSGRMPELVEAALPEARILLAKESFHFIFTPEDERMMAEAIKLMIDKGEKNEGTAC